MNGLDRAISIFKTRQALADALGVSGMAITKYARHGLPPRKVIPTARATNWQVTPHELDPELYPHPDDGLPDELRGMRDAA